MYTPMSEVYDKTDVMRFGLNPLKGRGVKWLNFDIRV